MPPRKGSDNFGDEVSGPATPTFQPSEGSQLRRRHLNETGLPNGVRDDLQEDGEGEGDDDGKKNGEKAPTLEPRTTGTRTRKGKLAENGPSVREKVRGRLKSPLANSLKLDDLREQISKGVEIK